MSRDRVAPGATAKINPFRALVQTIVLATETAEGDKAADGQASPRQRSRNRGQPADHVAELREQLRRLEAVRPRGTALTAVSRRDPLGWRAVLGGVGFGATGVGETLTAAIAHLSISSAAESSWRPTRARRAEVIARDAAAVSSGRVNVQRRRWT